ncbi:spoVK, partial [Symbiodinium sp. CCMP2456]
HPDITGDREPVFNEVARSDLVAQYVGQTAPKVQKEVNKSLGGVFFLDEAYSLVNGERDQFGHEAVDTLIKEMEDKRANFVVICAGYEDEMDAFFDSNPGFKSRVPFTFFFEDYTCPQLMEIGLLSLKPK